MVDWCPFAQRDELPGCSGSGPMQGGKPKILHHSTEGGSYPRSTYLQTHSIPHFTDTFETGAYKVYQHLPLSVGATALVHEGGITNTDNVIQIEHVGFATQAPGGVGDPQLSQNWPQGYLDGIAKLCRWIEAQTGCARVAVVFTSRGYGVWPGRLGWNEWDSYSGHLGHQHVPENDHGDPGSINIAAILGGTIPPAPTGEDGMMGFTDPKDGSKALCDADGGVYCFNADGSEGGHYLGGLNTHPAWNAGTGKANGPVVYFGPWNDNPGKPFSGYVLLTKDAAGKFHHYAFPSDGSLVH